MVGERIKSARLLLDMTQKELAEIVGISRTSLNRIENNKVPKMKASTAVQIARALNVPTDFLFYDECLQNESVQAKN